MITFFNTCIPIRCHTSTLAATLLYACLGMPILSAQNYMQIPLENAEWNLTTVTIDGNYQRLVFVGGEVLNGHIYHKAQNRDLCENSVYANLFWTYFRTDVSNSRLWIYSPYSNRETLVMDLNLEVGDQVSIGRFLPITAVVESVEQINGRKVITFQYEVDYPGYIPLYMYGPLRYIEGVGPTWVTGTDDYDSNPFGLSCIKQGGEVVFENPETYPELRYCADTCYVIFPIATNERQQSLPVSLFPNPSDGLLQIVSEAPLAQYSLYTLDGRLLQSAALRSEQEQLDLQHLSSGVYWLRIQDRQGRWALRKVFRR